MKYILSFIFILFFHLSKAQMYHSNWIFTYGNYVKFNHSNQSPYSLSLPIVFNNQLNVEGATTYSDFNGNLLLYTNGENVYNKYDEVLNSEPLDGSATVTQSSIIVPFPDHYNEFFLFTVNGSLGLTPDIRPEYWNYLGVNYYHIDLNKNNGRGKLTIPSNNKLLEHSSQKITATKHQNGKDFWVLTIRENKFYAYLINKNGVNAPIISTTNLNFDEGGHSPTLKGQLKISPKGDKIGIAHKNIISRNNFNDYIGATDYESIIDGNPNEAPGITLLYDFNPLTGEVTNEKIVYINFHTHFGVEFSPSGRFLYFNYNDLSFSGIAVYDTENNYLRSAYVAQDNPLNSYYKKGHLQLSLDGRIYHAQQGVNYLSCIEEPDEYVSYPAKYRTDCLSLVNNSTNGIANFGNYYFNHSIKLYNSFDEKSVCVNTPVTFWVNMPKTVESAYWDFGDGISSTEFYPVHSYSEPGQYTIQSIINGVEYSHIINVFSPIDLPNYNLYECQTNANETVYFNLEKFTNFIGDRAEYISYHLTNNDALLNINSLDDLIINNRSEIYARILGKGGCITITKINLIINTSQVINQSYEVCKIYENNQYKILINSIYDILGNDQIRLYSSLNDLLQYSHEIDNDISVTQAQTQLIIYIRVVNPESCDTYYRVNLNLKNPYITALEDRVLCPYQESTIYSIPTSAEIETIEWIGLMEEDLNQNLNGNEISISKTGRYSVIITGTNGCQYQDFFTVTKLSPLNIQIKPSQFGSYIIDYSDENTSEYEFSLDEGMTWNNGNTISNLAVGQYIIWIRKKNNTECILLKQPFFNDRIVNFFSPDDDGINDVWNVNGFEKYEWIEVKIYSRLGQLIFQNKMSYSNILWNGKVNGKIVSSNSYWYEIKTSKNEIYNGYLTVKSK